MISRNNDEVKISNICDRRTKPVDVRDLILILTHLSSYSLQPLSRKRLWPFTQMLFAHLIFEDSIEHILKRKNTKLLIKSWE